MENTLTFNGTKIPLEDLLIKEVIIGKYMVDASVVFKWYYEKNENDLVQAEIVYDLLRSDTHIILAPELLVFEILNICRLKEEIDIEKINKIISEIYDTLLLVGLDRDLTIKAFKYARQMNISFYDSIYVAISVKHEAPLITADKKLYTACKELNQRPLLLSEIDRL